MSADMTIAVSTGTGRYPIKACAKKEALLSWKTPATKPCELCLTLVLLAHRSS